MVKIDKRRIKLLLFPTLLLLPIILLVHIGLILFFLTPASFVVPNLLLIFLKNTIGLIILTFLLPIVFTMTIPYLGDVANMGLNLEEHLIENLENTDNFWFESVEQLKQHIDEINRTAGEIWPNVFLLLIYLKIIILIGTISPFNVEPLKQAIVNSILSLNYLLYFALIVFSLRRRHTISESSNED